MTEVTLTEYETTERTVEKIECDHCGVVVDEEEATTVWMKQTNEAGDTPHDVRGDQIVQIIQRCSDKLDNDHHQALRGNHVVNPTEIASKLHLQSQSGIETPVEKHLCEDCVGLREAIAVRERKDYYRAFWEGTKGKIGWILLAIPTFIFGIAQGILFANAEAPTLVERVGGSFLVFVLMMLLGLIVTGGLYQLLTADSSG